MDLIDDGRNGLRSCVTYECVLCGRACATDNCLPLVQNILWRLFVVRSVRSRWDAELPLCLLMLMTGVSNCDILYTRDLGRGDLKYAYDTQMRLSTHVFICLAPRLFRWRQGTIREWALSPDSQPFLILTSFSHPLYVSMIQFRFTEASHRMIFSVIAGVTGTTPIVYIALGCIWAGLPFFWTYSGDRSTNWSV